MSRKNAKVSNKTDVFTFDQRTKAVMAEPAQIDIKEKVQSVREVVPGHSNNEITLVLQYYDYSVENTIQAYLENGAKEALQEWQTPGSKEIEKKKKQKQKKKAKEQKEQKQKEANAVAAAEAAKEAAASNHVVPNGDILRNGETLRTEKSAPLNEVGDVLAPPSGATSLPGASATTAPAAAPSVSNSTLETNSHNKTSDIRVMPTSSHEALPQRGIKGGGGAARDRGYKGKASAATNNSGSTAAAANTSSRNKSTSKPDSSQSPTVAPSVVVSPPASSTPAQPDHAASSSQKESALQSSAASHKKPLETSGVTPSAALRTTTQQKNQGRPKTLDGSKGRSTNERAEAGSGTVVKDKPTRSIHLNTKRPLAGLEKAVKDLHRQTLALTRIKLMSADEFERCYKMISSVFEDLHTAMNEREADIIYEMDKVKGEANKVVAERQKKAADLKRRIDRSPAMSDSEVGELRHDIKVFVSDRKIDEELGSTQRFNCPAEELTRAIRNFGQVVGVRSGYGQRRNSVSSVSSSCISHDDLTSPSTPMTPMTPSSISAYGASLNSPLPRVVPTKLEQLEESPKPEPATDDVFYSKQIEELQEKFTAAFKAPSGVKRAHSSNSSTGVSSMVTSSLSEATASTSSAQSLLNTSASSSGSVEVTQKPKTAEDSKKGRSARRRQLAKERDRKNRNEHRQKQEEKNAPKGDGADQKNETKGQEKPQTSAAGDTQLSNATSELKPDNEPKSQPGRKGFDNRRERSASGRGRGSSQGGYNRGSSPSKRGGSGQRFYRGGYQGGNRFGGPGNRQNTLGNRPGQQQQGKPQEQRASPDGGAKPEGQPPKAQNQRGQSYPRYQRNKSDDRNSRPAAKDDSAVKNNVAKAAASNERTVNSAKQNGDVASSTRNNTQNTRDNVNRKFESVPRKELKAVPENKKESAIQNGKKEAVVENGVEKNNNNIVKEAPQSNGPKLANNNSIEEKSNGNYKVDENSNHRKSSATVRLTNNGNVPHEVSINDAPIVKKSVVSVEEVTRLQEMGLPQRKPRIKRAEVLVNGSTNGMVNGHVEE